MFLKYLIYSLLLFSHFNQFSTVGRLERQKLSLSFYDWRLNTAMRLHLLPPSQSRCARHVERPEIAQEMGEQIYQSLEKGRQKLPELVSRGLKFFVQMLDSSLPINIKLRIRLWHAKMINMDFSNILYWNIRHRTKRSLALWLRIQSQRSYMLRHDWAVMIMHPLVHDGQKPSSYLLAYLFPPLKLAGLGCQTILHDD